MIDIKSGCCGSDRFVCEESVPPVYRCSICREPVSWALIRNDRFVREYALAVFEDHDSKRWFAWHQVCDPTTVKELITRGQTLVCPTVGCVDSVEKRYNQDIDLIDTNLQKHFVREWRYLVENPEAVSHVLKEPCAPPLERLAEQADDS